MQTSPKGGEITCIRRESLRGQVYGSLDTGSKDRPIREELRARRYEVFEIAAGALDDRDRMPSYLFRLASILMGKEEVRRLKENPVWFDGD